MFIKSLCLSFLHSHASAANFGDSLVRFDDILPNHNSLQVDTDYLKVKLSCLCM